MVLLITALKGSLRNPKWLFYGTALGTFIFKVYLRLKEIMKSYIKLRDS